MAQGSIRKHERDSGVRYEVVDLGTDPVTGRRRQRSKSFKTKTHREGFDAQPRVFQGGRACSATGSKAVPVRRSQPAQGTFPNWPSRFSVTSSSATLTAVGEQAWDWSQHVVDHVEVHAGDFDASVRFYATVLAPLGIPSWSEDSESERIMCFTLVSIVDRQPPTTELHLCFVAASREQVDAFHHAGVEAGFRSNGAPGYRPYAPGYYAAFLLDPDDNNIEALYRDVGNPGYAG